MTEARDAKLWCGADVHRARVSCSGVRSIKFLGKGSDPISHPQSSTRRSGAGGVDR
jgi:hypothetical protein